MTYLLKKKDFLSKLFVKHISLTFLQLRINMELKHTIEKRFLRYVQVDTEADPFSTTSPSSEKQKVLSKILVEELHEMGLENAFTNEYGYVYATIPANTEKPIDGIFFCSHIDTAPDVTGKDVKPIVHRNYQGEDIVLPDDNTQIITPKKYPQLNDKFGHYIITASGKTLLGSDDKSGLAIIMDAMYQLLHHAKNIEHGDVSILFTTDEEIGKGVVHVDTSLIPAKFGYTLDGGDVGDYADQNFSADSAKLTITGVSAHPGYAKGKMEHSMKIAAAIIDRLPKDTLTPETTSGKEGFVHPTHIEGGLESTTVSFILRDFETAKLQVRADLIRSIADEVLKDYPGSTYTLEVKEQYRNMIDVIQDYPFISDLAIQAMKNAGIEPKPKAIRGGTDGAILSFRGLPCPNIFAAEQAIHSKHEWTSIQDMELAVRTILNIIKLNGER